MTKKILYGFWLLTFPLVAFAYIDPGASSYLIQGLIALLSAGFFYLRHPIELIKRIIKKILGK
jgi:hypothetical protein